MEYEQAIALAVRMGATHYQVLSETTTKVWRDRGQVQYALLRWVNESRKREFEGWYNCEVNNIPHTALALD